MWPGELSGSLATAQVKTKHEEHMPQTPPPNPASARTSLPEREYILPVDKTEASRSRQPLTILAAVGLCAVLLVLALRLDQADLTIPLNYLTDAVVFLAKAKGILQGDWIRYNSRLGMPFGSDLRDFPQNITFDSSLIWCLSWFIRGPGLLLNVYWILAVLATAASAAYCLLRLGVSRALAVSFGPIYALSPYLFYRCISHLHSLFYLVPLIATGAIELALGRFDSGMNSRRRLFRSVPPSLWFACVAAGLSYQYLAFFSCFVLACGGALAWLSRRNKREVLTAGLAIAVICLVALVDLSPSLIYWAREGTNPSQNFKYPAEAEIYGLKIRMLLTPVPDHPIPLFRKVEHYLTALQFPLETENRTIKLGTLGSVGFVLLIAFVLYGAVRNRAPGSETERKLGVLSALCLSCVLLATVGGFGALFNAFVIADIRCYNRIAPFISFFSLTAVALVLAAAQRRWVSGRKPDAIFAATMIVCSFLAMYDQRVIFRIIPHQEREQMYRADGEFVRAAEAIMPPDGMIFQLPYTDFPVEHLAGKMINNDQGRPYIHSTKCRWTWGAVSGTDPAEWNRQAAALPIPEMLNRLAHRGFAGLWVDLFGYGPQNSPEAALTSALGFAPLRSSDGRYLFYDLRSYTTRCLSAEGNWSEAQKRAQHPVELMFERGFYDEDRDATHVWHWARKRGRLVLVNPLNTSRQIRVSMVLHTGFDEPQNLRVSGAGYSDGLLVGRAHPWERNVDLPPLARVPLDFSCDCKRTYAPADPRHLYFVVDDLKIQDR